MRHTPIRCTSVRYTPTRYLFMRCMLINLVPGAFLVLVYGGHSALKLEMMDSCQQQDRLKVVSDCLYVQDAMYSSYTSILLVVVTHCCLHSRYQQAEIGRTGTSRHQLLTNRLVMFQGPTIENTSLLGG